MTYYDVYTLELTAFADDRKQPKADSCTATYW